MARELLFSLTKKDFVIETIRGSGPGGQKKNKTESCVRITHPESGAVGMSQDERSQSQNKKLAFERLLKSSAFKIWHTRKVLEIEKGKEIEAKVNRMMNEENLRIECQNEGKWQVCRDKEE